MKLLVADDDPTIRKLLKAVLSKWDFEVSEARDGNEAWAQLTGPEPARLAVLDWMMPGVDGRELCRRMKQLRQSAAPYVILLTARGNREDLVAGLASGADDFIVKPYDPQELRARIEVGRRTVQLQSELMALNGELERRVAERTAEVQRLLQYQRNLTVRLGHDLKTPLTPLLSLLPLLGQPLPENDRQEILQLALDSTRSMQTTVTRMLELCELSGSEQTLCFRPVELQRVVEDTLSAWLSDGKLGGRTVMVDVPEAISVRADVTWLQQALAHVIHNAVKFTQSNGRIALRGRQQQDTVVLSVVDDGAGIEQQHLDHLFEPFYKADPARQAHGAPGLGLTIAQAIIERHGGRIWAESVGLRQGTTLWLTLPLAKPQKEESQ